MDEAVNGGRNPNFKLPTITLLPNAPFHTLINLNQDNIIFDYTLW